MATKAPDNQAVLPGLESALCGCGCGKYFMRSTRGRKRLYINSTHKKRRARALATERTGGTRTRLEPLGWLYLKTSSMETAKHLWTQLAPSEQAVMAILCESGIPSDTLLDGITGLFARRLQP